ncbi:MAG: allantoicase [Bdellovibrionia bacterium]
MIIPAETSRLRVPFTDLLDLASEKVGGIVLSTSDDFFAPKENLIKGPAPIFIPDQFTEFGKWMDGWESRRKRNLSPNNDHDWCVIRLGIPGIIRGVNVDTSFFVGNYPESCSVEASEEIRGSSEMTWEEILPKSQLQGGIGNLFPILSSKRWTHLRLKIFPDGGVARLRVYGEVAPNWNAIKKTKELFDFAAVANGGQVISCSDMFFGQKDHLIFPGHPITMGEGWETRRRRGPGHDWTIIKLARTAKLQKLEINTHHFKGNFPESCSVDALTLPINASASLEPDLSPSDFRDRPDLQWRELLPRIQLQANAHRIFEKELLREVLNQNIDYLRLNIYPDGGISRLRAYGTLE